MKQPSLPNFPTLKTGENVYWDTFAGLVPVKVVSIKSRDPLNHRPSSDHEVIAKVTRDHGPYRKGETVSGWSIHFPPAKAIKRRKYSSTIGYYNVIADNDIAIANPVRRTHYRVKR